MKYTSLSSSFFSDNRARLAQELKVGSVLVLHANDIFPTNADGTFALHQNANFFYLTGIDQEESILVMRILKGGDCKSTLLVRETNDQIAIWEGAKLTIQAAQQLSGIDDVRWTSEYDRVLQEAIPDATTIYIETNEHPRCINPVETRNMRLGNELRASFPKQIFENIYGILAEMRMVKQPEEIRAMQQACNITADGFTAILPHIKPGMGEWEVEGLLSCEYLKRRARKFSFLPILASGSNSCVLHYIINDQIMKEGDLLLMDIGAEYGNYNGDMTRTIPVSGKFTQRQRAVYEAVMRIMDYANSIMRPGVLKSEYERLVRVYVGKELVGLHLLTQSDLDDDPNDPPAVRRYFMHGCSHSLGLDVHDVGSANPVFAPHMIFTIEPGIYIREEAIGIRLENDVIIGENGNLNLLARAPLAPDEIESLMSKAK
ncbi:MAG: aminopeptidase P N-terminal domain-containing protein [Akkermansia sp.]